MKRGRLAGDHAAFWRRRLRANAENVIDSSKLVLVALALLAGGPSLAAEPPVYGVWLRDGHEERLEFYDCDGKLCAREDALTSVEGGPPQIVLRSAPKIGNNQWKGELFNPENGKSYTGKIHYNPPSQLTLTGCLIAFLCQSETWTRLDQPPVNSPVAPAPAPPPHGKFK
jgi:uncharacterized protein (DUF2147 family)